MSLTFDDKMRLLELDDRHKARRFTPAESAEYLALVVAWRSEHKTPSMMMTEEISEVIEELREER